MKLLSIDVGIKNLALCLFDVSSNSEYCIEKWNVSDLCNEQKVTCLYCEKPAKYTCKNSYSCKKHSKELGYPVIPAELELNKLKKSKINEMRELLCKHNITFDNKKSKVLLLEEIQTMIESTYVIPFNNTTKTTDFSLIEIGINLKAELDRLYKDIHIDVVIIENQISPIANRMKTLQGMIAQYFIMKNITDIHFISACNKLKDYTTNKQTTYSDRKKKGIEVCEEILINNTQFSCNLSMFEKSKKKDDLADCFLQGLWFLKDQIIYN